MPMIGFLSSTSPEVYADRLLAFGKGLREEGYIAGTRCRIGSPSGERDCDVGTPSGSGLRFEDQGLHALKGLPEDVHVYAALNST
jgi:hypothetical protein